MQVKTHAQSSLKRLDQGGDIFAFLDLDHGEPMPIKSYPDPALCPSHSHSSEEDDVSSHCSFFSDELDDDDDSDDVEAEDEYECTTRSESGFASSLPALGTSISSPSTCSLPTGMIDLTFDAAVRAAQNAIDGNYSIMNGISPLTLLRRIDSRQALPTARAARRPFSIQTPVPNIHLDTGIATQTHTTTTTVTGTPTSSRNGKENKNLNAKGDDAMLSSAAKILLELASPASTAFGDMFTAMAMDTAAVKLEVSNANASDASHNNFVLGRYYYSAHSPSKRIASV